VDAEIVMKVTGHQWYWSNVCFAILPDLFTAPLSGPYPTYYYILLASDQWFSWVKDSEFFGTIFASEDNNVRLLARASFEYLNTYPDKDPKQIAEMTNMPNMTYVMDNGTMYVYFDNQLTVVFTVIFEEYSADKKIEINYGDDLIIAATADLLLGQPRLLTTEKEIIIPALINVKGLITSTDVLHSFSIPSLGIKMDAVPGRINQISFVSDRWGIFAGQCSELCGTAHANMPVVLKVLNVKEFVKSQIENTYTFNYTPDDTPDDYILAPFGPVNGNMMEYFEFLFNFFMDPNAEIVVE